MAVCRTNSFFNKEIVKTKLSKGQKERFRAELGNSTFSDGGLSHICTEAEPRGTLDMRSYDVEPFIFSYLNSYVWLVADVLNNTDLG